MRKCVYYLVVLWPVALGIAVAIGVPFVVQRENVAAVLSVATFFIGGAAFEFWWGKYLKVSGLDRRLLLRWKVGRCMRCGRQMVECKCEQPVPNPEQ